MTALTASTRRTTLRRVARHLACAALLLALPHGLQAQGLAAYRDFAMGSSVGDVSARAKLSPMSAKTLHQRPAMRQELEWRPSNWMTGESTDPVDKVTFSFYNDQLFRIVVDYSRERTAGLTEADIVDALVATYGAAAPTSVGPSGRLRDDESADVVSRWEDGAHSVVLHRPASYGFSFRLVMTDTRLVESARVGDAEAERLDQSEAPARELARQKQALDDERATTEKARTLHKRDFRP